MGQFDWTPDEYLERIRARIPRYDELQEQAVAAIPFPPERVLELGMGTGETTRRLIEAHPDAWVIGLDSSPDMVFRARQTYDDVQLARMEDPLPDGPWDLVISVLSVSDLDDDQQQALFRRVKDHSRSLVIGDVFEPEELEKLVEWSQVSQLGSRRPGRGPRRVLRKGRAPLRAACTFSASSGSCVPEKVERGGVPGPSPLPCRDPWPSQRREPPAPGATSGAQRTRPARPASTAARAVTARACRIASARPAAPTRAVR